MEFGLAGLALCRHSRSVICRSRSDEIVVAESVPRVIRVRVRVRVRVWS